MVADSLSWPLPSGRPPEACPSPPLRRWVRFAMQYNIFFNCVNLKKYKFCVQFVATSALKASDMVETKNVNSDSNNFLKSSSFKNGLLTTDDRETLNGSFTRTYFLELLL